MANMGYCRFQNTLDDFIDCLDRVHDTDLSDSEDAARTALYYKAVEFIQEVEQYDGVENINEKCDY